MTDPTPPRRARKPARKTSPISLRFDERTRYGLDRAATIANRSAANYVEWAVAESFAGIPVLPRHGTKTTPLSTVLTRAWSEHPDLALARVAHDYPSLLTARERWLWRRIAGDEALWGGWGGYNPTFEHALDSLDFSALRALWDDLAAEADAAGF